MFLFFFRASSRVSNASLRGGGGEDVVIGRGGETACLLCGVAVAATFTRHDQTAYELIERAAPAAVFPDVV
jgi:hypothetical protein